MIRINLLRRMQNQEIRPGQVISTYKRVLREQGIDPKFNITDGKKESGKTLSIEIVERKTGSPIVLINDPLSEWGKETENKMKGFGNDIKSTIMDLYKKSKGWSVRLSGKKGQRITLPEKVV